MALTPLDIHHKEFRSARFGGYNEEEVDSFLDLIADEFEGMIQEGAELKHQVEHLKQRLTEFEEMQNMLQSALLAATKSAETLKEDARQESEVVKTKAKEEADALIRDAQERAREVTLRAENEASKLEGERIKLEEIKKHYMQGLKEIAESHLLQVRELESMEGEEAPAEDIQPKDESVKVEGESVPGTVDEPPLQDTREETSHVSSMPAAAELRIAETEVKPIEDIPRPPTLESSIAPQIDMAVAEPALDLQGEEHPEEGEATRIVAGTGMDSRYDDPRVQVVQGGRVEVAENSPPPSSDLIEEVLPVQDRERVYAEFEDIEGDTELSQKGRKGRRGKREKHFFWE